MPQFKLDIPSEADTLRREKRDYSLHPSLHRRLEQFAKSNNSSAEYVLAHILDNTLPAERAEKKSSDKGEKAQGEGLKEASRKVA